MHCAAGCGFTVHCSRWNVAVDVVIRSCKFHSGEYTSDYDRTTLTSMAKTAPGSSQHSRNKGMSPLTSCSPPPVQQKSCVYIVFTHV